MNELARTNESSSRALPRPRKSVDHRGIYKKQAQRSIHFTPIASSGWKPQNSTSLSELCLWKLSQAVCISFSRFSINLKCKSSGNIALHFNPRLDRGYVVRNTKLKGCWEDEETCSPVSSRGYVFRRNSFFHLTIFCTLNEFQVRVLISANFTEFWMRIEGWYFFSFVFFVADCNRWRTLLCLCLPNASRRDRRYWIQRRRRGDEGQADKHFYVPRSANLQSHEDTRVARRQASGFKSSQYFLTVAVSGVLESW